jgi:hypothetical protein
MENAKISAAAIVKANMHHPSKNEESPGVNCMKFWVSTTTYQGIERVDLNF